MQRALREPLNRFNQKGDPPLLCGDQANRWDTDPRLDICGLGCRFSSRWYESSSRTLLIRGVPVVNAALRAIPALKQRRKDGNRVPDEPWHEKRQHGS